MLIRRNVTRIGVEGRNEVEVIWGNKCDFCTTEVDLLRVPDRFGTDLPENWVDIWRNGFENHKAACPACQARPLKELAR
jgi:hypothetical protein